MSSLKTYLTTIADAIRQKKGTTEPIKGKNFASEILSIQAGGSLNVAYSLTPPTDTSKIWLQCAEPTSVEVQNYLGECAVSNVANWGNIDGTIYYSYCNSYYIGNNQIAIVGSNHIRIFDISTKAYIADYAISVGTSNNYFSKPLFKDNVLYFGYNNYVYSFNLATQILTQLCSIGSTDNYIRYIYFKSDNEISILYTYGSQSNYYNTYNLTTGSLGSYSMPGGNQFRQIKNHTIKVNNTIYNFYMYQTASTNYYTWKLNTLNLVFTTFTSFYNFMLNLGWTEYYYSSTIYDGERYIYLIGGYGTYNGTTTKSNLIIKYDTLNDTFELLDNKLIGVKYNHFSELVDNRIYIFGGQDDRRNLIDYFDLQYPLTQNNAILTINNKTDKYLPLINTEKLKLNSNIASAYLGNANNLAEKVNAYHHNGYGWAGINCDDYTEE